MYNLWWITIAVAIIFVILIIVMIATHCDINENLKDIIEFGFTMVLGIALLILLGFSIENPIKATQEYYDFVETRTMVEQVYSGDYTELENAGLNNAIIEVNKWLTKAKASKKQWGNWSMYYALDLDSLDYIVLKKVESGEE